MGHTTVSQTSACTKGIVSDYLLNSKVSYCSPPPFFFFFCMLVLTEEFFCSCLNRIPSARRIRVISSRIMLPAPAGPSGASEGKRAMRADPSPNLDARVHQNISCIVETNLYHPVIHSFDSANTSHSFDCFSLYGSWCGGFCRTLNCNPAHRDYDYVTACSLLLYLNPVSRRSSIPSFPQYH